MIAKLGLLASASAFALLLSLGGSAPAQAADIYMAPPPVPVPAAPPQHRFAGTVEAGYLWTGLDYDIDLPDSDDGDGVDSSAFFGGAAVLFGPAGSNLNFQGDFAFHGHKFDGSDYSLDEWHAGGIVFWRDPAWGLIGVDGSFINLDAGTSAEFGRVGGRGEFFAGQAFTLGGGAGYLWSDFFGTDTSGFDANLWARFYPTDNVALKLRGDYGNLDFDQYDASATSWAVTGEGEYLFAQVPISIFAGARFAQTNGDGTKSFEFTLDEKQVFGGARFYFGSGGPGTSLASHHRNNTLDNTSVFLERLPFSSFGGKAP
jgi:hypothetical protein